MKVKLDQKHQWIVENCDNDDDENDILEITTPHGHQFQIIMNVLDRELCDPYELSSVSEKQWDDWETKYPLYSAFSWYNENGELYIFDTNGLKKVCDNEEIAIAHVSKVIYDKTIKYDQECENTRSLQILARFAEHLLDRPSVLDVFTQKK